MATARWDARSRMERAATQRIYLLDRSPDGRAFSIQGTRGHTYCVTLASDPRCTCPDHVHNAHRCKHIYFVLRQLGVEPTTRRFLGDEVAAMLDMPVVAQRRRHAQVVTPSPRQRLPYVGETCAVCLEPMQHDEQEPNWACCRCGNSVHSECFRRWYLRNQSCVHCRTPIHE